MAKAKASRSGRTIPPLVVRYPRRMKAQKTYSVQVSWRSREKPKLPAGTGPLTVRLVMAGAQVIPSEQSLDAAKPASKTVFYVTPLVRRGWLKGERLEVLYEGEKLQEVALPAKVTTQRKAWLFLLLAFVVPWLLVNYIKLEPGEYDAVARNGGPWHHIRTDVEESVPWLKDAEVQDALTQGVKAVGLDTDSFGKAYDWGHHLLTRDELFMSTGKTPAYLPFWTAVGFLLLALLSWFFHREKWQRKISKPIPMPEEG